jgi:hypothetical protein
VSSGFEQVKLGAVLRDGPFLLRIYGKYDIINKNEKIFTGFRIFVDCTGEGAIRTSVKEVRHGASNQSGYE